MYVYEWEGVSVCDVLYNASVRGWHVPSIDPGGREDRWWEVRRCCFGLLLDSHT